MWYNPFRGLRRREWALWMASLLAVLIPAPFTPTRPVTLLATVIGVTALILVARGDVWGQALTVVFSLLYSLAAWPLRYYGEIITYLGMSAPIALLSVVTWLKNPYRRAGESQSTGGSEVKIHRLTRRQGLALALTTLLMTVAFYFTLKALGNASLLVSTLSVTTSFAAASLLMLRSSYYAVAYAANDIVLIVLWLLASLKDPANLPMLINFLAFLANDLYGFISWKRREKKQANRQ